MSEDITQEPTVEAPLEGQAEAVATEGVEDTVVSPSGTDNSLQSQDPLETAAEASLFETLRAQKGWETPEDMAKAYKEAEGELTRRSQALNKTQEDYQAIESVLEGLINGDVTPDQFGEDPYERYQAENSETLSRTRKLEARLDVRTVAEKHPDFIDVQPLMNEILLSAPNKSVFEGEKGIELLYRMAKADKMDAEISNAKKEGAKAVQLSEVAKVRAGVADGTKAKQPSTPAFTRESIKNMSTEEYLSRESEILDQGRRGLIK